MIFDDPCILASRAAHRAMKPPFKAWRASWAPLASHLPSEDGEIPRT